MWFLLAGLLLMPPSASHRLASLEFDAPTSADEELEAASKRCGRDHFDVGDERDVLAVLLREVAKGQPATQGQLQTGLRRLSSILAKAHAPNSRDYVKRVERHLACMRRQIRDDGLP